MLDMYTVSWSSYVIGIAACMLVYYAIVYLFVLGKGKRLIGRKTKEGGTETASENVTIKFGTSRGGERKGNDKFGAVEKKQDDDKRVQAQVHEMVNELQSYLRQAGIEEVEKHELTISLRHIVSKYPLVVGSVFQDGIRNLIAVTVEDHCSYRLSADDLAGIWKGDEA